MKILAVFFHWTIYISFWNRRTHSYIFERYMLNETYLVKSAQHGFADSCEIPRRLLEPLVFAVNGISSREVDLQCCVLQGTQECFRHINSHARRIYGLRQWIEERGLLKCFFVNWGFVRGKYFNIVYLFSGKSLNLQRRGSELLEREVKTRS